MNIKMGIVSAVAVVSTLVAGYEGVLLMHRPAVAPPAVVAPEPVASAPIESPAPAPLPAQLKKAPVAEPLAPPVPPAPPTSQPVVAASELPAPVAATATSATSAEPALTDEEKAAKDKALAKAKLQEAMALQMDQATKQMIDRLKLRDDQKQQAAPTLDNIRQAMSQMMAGPMKAGEDMGPKIDAIRQNGLIAHLSQDQIDAQIKAEQTKMTALIQDQVVGGLGNVSTSLEDLRPILDVSQTATLDQMKKEITQQQAMMKKMMNAMTQPDAPAAPNAP